MILRLAAALSLILGTTLFLLYLTIIGRAPWCPPWLVHMRAMKERRTAPPSYAPTTFAAMNALPRRAALARYTPLEQRGVSLEGYVQGMDRAPDGDIHLDYVPAATPDSELVSYVAAEITWPWREHSAWGYERLLEAFRPWHGGATAWETPPRRARVSGWLMYDVQYEGSPPRTGFPPLSTSWEIHPVTRIEVWDDSLARFVELAR